VERYTGLLGLIVMMFVAWLMSSNRKVFPWRVVIGGLVLQITFALITLKVPGGDFAFRKIGDGFTELLNYVDSGASFVFGDQPPVMVEQDTGGVKSMVATPPFKVHFVAFKVLPTIIFFSSLMSLMYYFGVMQLIVKFLAGIMQKTLGTSGAESLSAAGNIFVGQTESPLLIKPYLNEMTDSEIMAVMVGGFATIAGGVMAAYVSFGIDPVHLLTASLMSAPAALVVAKILQPEVDKPKTLGTVEVTPRFEAVNPIDAAARGASDGLMLALNVGAMLIAFLALVKLFDSLLFHATFYVGYQFTFTDIFGYISTPFAFLMGIESNECLVAGRVLARRIMTNEFIAYLDLGTIIAADKQELSPRSVKILTYALCGFANFGSIGIQIGGLGPLAPQKRGTLVRIGLRAMFGGILACYMTACIASVLID
jgi:concentrative nucleoside transporter, CNT family